MLAINESGLKKIARTEKDEESKRKYKTYQVSGGDVIVGSDNTAVKVSNFSPLDDGFFEFGSDQVTTIDYDLATYFMDFTADNLTTELSVPLLHHIYGMLSSWLKSKSEITSTLDVRLSLRAAGEFTTELEVRADYDANYPGLRLNYTLPIKVDAASYVVNAKEFLLFLSPFQQLKSTDDNPLSVLLCTPKDALNGAGVCSDKFYLSVAYNGHVITSVYVVAPMRPKREDEEKNTTVNVED